MNKENKKLEISFERVEAAYKSTENESVKETLEAIFGKEAFKDQAKDFLDYRNIKSLKDVSEALGKDMDEFKKSLSNLPRDVQAFMVLREIRNALNPKWVPDFANINQYKYYPWFEIKKSPAGVGNALDGSYLGVSVLNSYRVASYSDAYYGGALASEKSEIAIWFGEHFADLWKEYLLPTLE